MSSKGTTHPCKAFFFFFFFFFPRVYCTCLCNIYNTFYSPTQPKPSSYTCNIMHTYIYVHTQQVKNSSSTCLVKPFFYSRTFHRSPQQYHHHHYGHGHSHGWLRLNYNYNYTHPRAFLLRPARQGARRNKTTTTTTTTPRRLCRCISRLGRGPSFTDLCSKFRLYSLSDWIRFVTL